MALTLKLTPGYQFAPNELQTADKLNALGQPVVDLDGTVGSIALADNSVSTAKLQDGVLSADAAGRAKMADGFVTAAKLDSSAVLTAGIGGARRLAISIATASAIVTAQEALVRTGANVPAWLQGINVTINTANSGANGLDTGTRTASNWYYLFIIYNGTTIAGLASLSANSPTMPSGYTYSLLVGAVYCNSSNAFDLYDQVGERIYREETSNLLGSGGGVATFTLVSLAAIVPPIARSVIGNLGLIANVAKSLQICGGSNSANTRGFVTYNGNTASAPTASPLNGWSSLREYEVEMQNAQQLLWKSSDTTASTYKLTVTGWRY